MNERKRGDSTRAGGPICKGVGGKLMEFGVDLDRDSGDVRTETEDPTPLDLEAVCTFFQAQ
jgi:hypothetical protein